MSKSRKRKPGSLAAWRAANKDRVRRYDRTYYAKNQKKQVSKSSEWRKKNADRFKAYLAKESTKAARSRAQRRAIAKKRGYAECIDFPPPPTDSKCDICLRAEKLVLDHDHATGMFRGYLCVNCNLGLGHLGDSIEGVSKAMSYLERAYGQ